MNQGNIFLADRSVISVHTKPETSERLSRLAKATRRSKSFLANAAIERYLDAEEEFVSTIQTRISTAEERRIVSSDDLLGRFKFRMETKFDNTTS